MTDNRPPYWPLAVALILTLAVAAGLRLVRLPDLPLGLHYDEAANGILASEIARGLERPIFIPSYTGKEVLFFYWAAVWMRAVGEGVLALRLTAAVVGTCTVAAAAWATYELFHHRRDAAWVAAFTAAFLATAFWHVILSRLGFRAITQPLLQALTVAALWRGLRLEHKGWLALGGLFCGATAYTYLAARAFPVPLAVALLTLLASDRRRARLGQMALFVAAAALALAPLAAYFVAHPAALTTRMGQVASTSWHEAWAGFRACLGMFFLQGDPYIRFNLPGRPLFDPLTALLFLLGIAALFRAPQIDRAAAMHRASRVLLLAVIPVMLLPSALATGEITPSNLRVVGILPFVYVLPGLALSEGIRLARMRNCESRMILRNSQFFIRNSQFFIRNSHFLLLCALLLASSLTTASAFSRWATSPELYHAADGDLVDVATYLDQTDLSNVTPYVASIHYRHPTLAFLAEDYPSVEWLTGGETLVVPAQGTGLLILPRSADGATSWIETLISEAVPLAAPPAPDGAPAFHAYHIPAGTQPEPALPFSANFGNVVTLLGYELLSLPRSGGAAEVHFTWRVENPAAPGDLMPAVRLTDAWGHAWGEARPFHYPAEQWTPGEVVIDHITIPIAPGAPPGDYAVHFSFFAASTGTTLPVLDAAAAYAGSDVVLPIPVEAAEHPADPAALSIRQPLDPPSPAGLTLLGANLDTTNLRPGEPLHLTLFWRADRVPDPGLTVRLELGSATLYEGAPVHGTYPTAEWAAGTVVADRYDPRLSRHAPPGTFPLTLTLLDAAGSSVLGPLPLGEVTITAIARTFEPPPMPHALDVTLGEQVALLGYAVDPTTVTLYWQALAEMEVSYTVFVHLLGPEGSVAQHDGIPVDGTYPTFLWAAGEIVADAHTLNLPPGAYTLEVGMYVAETGARLAVPGTDDNAVRIPLDVDSDTD